MPGRLITFEGGEGAGKTTLIASLQEALRAKGFEVMVTREPGGTPLGEQIRHLLLHAEEEVAPRAELLLFLASRAQHVKRVIQPAIAAGKVVLCDRFTESSLAYQRDTASEGLLEQITYFGAYDLTPDCTLYLDLDPQVGLSRAEGGGDKIESRKLEFHQKVRHAFLEMAKVRTHMRVIDASDSREAVFKSALQELERVI